MRAFLVAAVACAALFAAGCSSGRPAPQVARPSTAARSENQTQAYVASPAKHFEAQAESRKREAAATKARAGTRSAGATATPVARPPVAARTFPEPAVLGAEVAAPVRMTNPACPPVHCPPVCDPCAGGKCCVPAPFCCDPCAGGKCGIPEPVWDCPGR